MILNNRICKNCGCTFSGGPRAWYCQICSSERKRHQTLTYHRRKQKGDVRPLGSTDKCVICGDNYTVNSGLQQYCSKCAPDAIKQIDRKQGLEYYASNKDKINPARNHKRRISLKTCPICGVEFKDHAKRICCNNPKCRSDYVNKRWREKYYPKRKFKITQKQEGKK